MIDIKVFVEGPVDANNYLVTDIESKEAVLIDCSDSISEFIDAVNYCFILFECAVLIGMKVAFDYATVLSVACIACIMTGALYFGYTVYDFIHNLPKKSK